MIKIVTLTFIFLNFFNILNASLKDEIILNLKKTENLSFNFKQTINDKVELGNCIIKYPKKIFCSYKNKIIVSNGKILIIKNIVNNQHYSYPLKKLH